MGVIQYSQARVWIKLYTRNYKATQQNRVAFNFVFDIFYAKRVPTLPRNCGGTANKLPWRGGRETGAPLLLAEYREILRLRLRMTT